MKNARCQHTRQSDISVQTSWLGLIKPAPAVRLMLQRLVLMRLHGPNPEAACTESAGMCCTGMSRPWNITFFFLNKPNSLQNVNKCFEMLKQQNLYFLVVFGFPSLRGQTPHGKWAAYRGAGKIIRSSFFSWAVNWFTFHFDPLLKRWLDPLKASVLLPL